VFGKKSESNNYIPFGDVVKNLLKYKLVGTNHLEKLKMANLNTMQHTRQAKDLKLMQEMLMGRASLIFSDFFNQSKSSTRAGKRGDILPPNLKSKIKNHLLLLGILKNGMKI
jgi:hypothetical protein